MVSVKEMNGKKSSQNAKKKKILVRADINFQK